MNRRDYKFITVESGRISTRLAAEEAKLEKRIDKIIDECDHKKPDGRWNIKFNNRDSLDTNYRCKLCAELITKKKWTGDMVVHRGDKQKKIGVWRKRSR